VRGRLVPLVFHASQAWFGILVNPDNMLGSYLGYTAIMAVTAIVVVLINGAQNLSRKNERIALEDV
jgi:uncharacterized membrane protein